VRNIHPRQQTLDPRHHVTSSRQRAVLPVQQRHLWSSDNGGAAVNGAAAVTGAGAITGAVAITGAE